VKGLLKGELKKGASITAKLLAKDLLIEKKLIYKN
jgi:hypothetical protein